MPLPAIPAIAYYAAAAAAGAFLLFRKKPGTLTAIRSFPPAVALPMPPEGQPIPPGFDVAAGGNGIIQAIPFGTNGFVPDSDPSLLNNPLFLQPLPVGLCITVDIGAAGLIVEGIPNGVVLFRITEPMDGTNAVKASPVDPRLVPGSPDMIVPRAAITGGGDC